VSSLNNVSGEVARLLADLRRDGPGAEDRLFRVVHGELRRIAGSMMREQRRDHTLQPTALVHEAYLKLMGGGTPDFADRTHFLRAAARAMRTVLVDMARARGAEKRGGGRLRVTLRDTVAGAPGAAEDVVAVHDALERLESLEPAWARVVELRFFAGLGPDETARVMDVSAATVHRLWTSARAWLFRELRR
jgi:RNA polymerase sigma factor (TIGR02999 family)